MHHVLVVRLGHTGRSELVALLVLVLEVEAQADNDNDQQRVAAQVRREGDEVARAVPAEEDLGTCVTLLVDIRGSDTGCQEWLTNSVARRPDDKVEGDANALLRLAGDVTRQHGQGEGLSRPEGESDVVADEQADLLAERLERDRHEADGADEGAADVSV